MVEEVEVLGRDGDLDGVAGTGARARVEPADGVGIGLLDGVGVLHLWIDSHTWVM